MIVVKQFSGGVIIKGYSNSTAEAYAIKYHRTFSQIINGLIDNKFEINKVLEPKPVNPYIDNKRNIECIHKPYFLIIKALKKC